jgi:FkbH-like protein
MPEGFRRGQGRPDARPTEQKGMNAMPAENDVLNRIRRLRNAGADPDPGLLADLTALTGPAALATAGRLLADLPVELFAPADWRPRPLRIALAGTFTAASVAPTLRVLLLRSGVRPEIQVAGFDQLSVQFSDPASDLARFAPDLTLGLLHDGALLPRDWDPADPDGLREPIAERLDLIRRAVRGFTARTSSLVALHTVPLAPGQRELVIGHRGRARLGRIWRQLNDELLALAETDPLVHVLDLEAVLLDAPGPVRDERLYRFASMAWAAPAELAYAQEAGRLARAVAGASRKVLVLDLDNTLWGGVLGDDGPAGIQLGESYPGNCYTELQRAAVGLGRQGVLLALCSKNDPELVDDVLARHPGQVLRAGDLVARMVNWDRKDHNLRQLAEGLNLGLDSLVFVDDSRFECELVRRNLPQVHVVHLDGDPAGHVSRVLAGGHFDVPATNATDADRTALYRTRAQRQEFASSFASATDYLSELGLRVCVRSADEFTLPRMIQLGCRTNQFNLAGGNPPEGRTRQLAGSGDVLGFEVSDRFGAEGLVGVVWLARHPDRWQIENLVMSCRVFARGVEHAVLAALARAAAGAGVPELTATWHPSGRNGPAREFFQAVAGRSEKLPGGAVRYRIPVPAPDLLPAWVELDATTLAGHLGPAPNPAPNPGPNLDPDPDPNPDQENAHV